VLIAVIVPLSAHTGGPASPMSRMTAARIDIRRGYDTTGT
jgi:hypothetical protein